MHTRVVRSGHTGAVVANISYGDGIPTDGELRLSGDVSGGKRAVELGVSDWFNAVEFAQAGAKAIAVDPTPTRSPKCGREQTPPR